MYSVVGWKRGQNELMECEPTSKYHYLIKLILIFKDMDVHKGTLSERNCLERFIALNLPRDYKSSQSRFSFLQLTDTTK